MTREESVAGQFAARTLSYFNPFGELVEKDVRGTNSGGSASSILSYEDHDSYFTYMADGRIDDYRRQTDWDATLGGYKNETQLDYFYDLAGRLTSLTSRYRRRTTSAWPSYTVPWKQTAGFDLAYRMTQTSQTWDTTITALATRPATEGTTNSYDNAGQLTSADCNQSGQDATYAYSSGGNDPAHAFPRQLAIRALGA